MVRQPTLHLMERLVMVMSMVMVMEEPMLTQAYMDMDMEVYHEMVELEEHRE